MAKPDSNFKNMVITLFSITALAASILGLTYSFTKPMISNVAIKKTNKALEMVLPKFEGSPEKNRFSINAQVSGLDSLVCYPAFKNNELVGIAVKTSTMKGFGGLVRIMVGFKPDGSVFDTFVLEHKETPGLGTGMKEEPFKKRIRDKKPNENPLQVKKDGGEIDALTAATISSRAFCDGINNAAKQFQIILETAKKQSEKQK